MAAPAPRPRRVPSPPARVPGERWSGVGPEWLPPAPSLESRSPSERKGEGAGGGGGGSQRPRGRAQRGPPPRDLPWQGCGHPTPPLAPPTGGPLPRLEPGGGTARNLRATSLPSPSLSEFLWISIHGREWGSGRGEGKQFVEADRRPLAAAAPLPLPGALAAQWLCAPEAAAETARPRGLPRARLRGSTLPLSDTTAAVSGERRRRGADVIGSENRTLDR